jgi:hypothetical protein
MPKNQQIAFAAAMLASAAFVGAAMAADSADRPSSAAEATATVPDATAGVVDVTGDKADAAFAKKPALHHVVHRRPSRPATLPPKVVRVASRTMEGRVGGCLSAGCSPYLILGVGF